MSEKYDLEYFDSFSGSSRTSAEVIVPIVSRWVNPRSVIDLGCGPGIWLSVWREAGCEIRGVDGDWIDPRRLAIPREAFITHDLSTTYVPDRTYDLAMSVEVAEHLPPDAARPLIGALTAAAPVVLFSAAIPHQPGRNHVNSQWPDYWAGLFAENGYVVIDALREMLWEDARVDWWYQQNIMLFADEAHLHRSPALQAIRRDRTRPPLRLVHPILFNTWVEWGIAESERYWELRAEIDRDDVTPSQA